MYQSIIVVHVLLGLGIIGLVLMQHGKGADAGAAFGSASSGSVFGAQGASSFLSRSTAILATLFFITSLGLAILSGHNGNEPDLMDQTNADTAVADLPVIVDGQNKMNATDEQPNVKDDLPTAVIDNISNQIDDAAKNAVNKLDNAIEQTQNPDKNK